MASRGSLGGLASTTAGIVQALDAAGYEIILIETVGAGQAEVDIARLAHTTLVVEAPGLGDDIQAIKAGILEIADVLVVNKADRPGVESTERALRSTLELAHPAPRVFQNHHHISTLSIESRAERDRHGEKKPGPDPLLWVPPILRTVATEGDGVPQLAVEIKRHYQYLKETGEWERRERARLRSEVDQLLRDTLVARWRANVSEGEYRSVLENVVDRRLSPWQAMEQLLHGGER
jgi:LAO/AO transport system kinase